MMVNPQTRFLKIRIQITIRDALRLCMLTASKHQAWQDFYFNLSLPYLCFGWPLYFIFNNKLMKQ
ncbi:unnamed protein product [Musa banksii]